MIGGTLLIIGLFLAACIAASDHWRRKEDREGDDYIASPPFPVVTIIVILAGLGFIIASPGGVIPEASFLWTFFVFVAVLDGAQKGIGSIFALIAEVAVLAYIIFGAFY